MVVIKSEREEDKAPGMAHMETDGGMEPGSQEGQPRVPAAGLQSDMGAPAHDGMTDMHADPGSDLECGSDSLDCVEDPLQQQLCGRAAAAAHAGVPGPAAAAAVADWQQALAWSAEDEAAWEYGAAGEGSGKESEEQEEEEGESQDVVDHDSSGSGAAGRFIPDTRPLLGRFVRRKHSVFLPDRTFVKMLGHRTEQWAGWEKGITVQLCVAVDGEIAALYPAFLVFKHVNTSYCRVSCPDLTRSHEGKLVVGWQLLSRGQYKQPAVQPPAVQVPAVHAVAATAKAVQLRVASARAAVMGATGCLGAAQCLEAPGRAAGCGTTATTAAASDDAATAATAAASQPQPGGGVGAGGAGAAAGGGTEGRGGSAEEEREQEGKEGEGEDDGRRMVTDGEAGCVVELACICIYLATPTAEEMPQLPQLGPPQTAHNRGSAEHFLYKQQLGALLSDQGVRTCVMRLISPARIRGYRKPTKDRESEPKEVPRRVMVTLRLSRASCQLLGGHQLLAAPDGATTAQEEKGAAAEGRLGVRRAGRGSGGAAGREEGHKEVGAGEGGGAWQLSAQCPVSPPLPCLIVPLAPKPGSHHWYARLQSQPGCPAAATLLKSLSSYRIASVCVLPPAAAAGAQAGQQTATDGRTVGVAAAGTAVAGAAVAHPTAAAHERSTVGPAAAAADDRAEPHAASTAAQPVTGGEAPNVQEAGTSCAAAAAAEGQENNVAADSSGVREEGGEEGEGSGGAEGAVGAEGAGAGVCASLRVNHVEIELHHPMVPLHSTGPAGGSTAVQLQQDTTKAAVRGEGAWGKWRNGRLPKAPPRVFRDRPAATKQRPGVPTWTQALRTDFRSLVQHATAARKDGQNPRDGAGATAADPGGGSTDDGRRYASGDDDDEERGSGSSDWSGSSTDQWGSSYGTLSGGQGLQRWVRSVSPPAPPQPNKSLPIPFLSKLLPTGLPSSSQHKLAPAAPAQQLHPGTQAAERPSHRGRGRESESDLHAGGSFVEPAAKRQKQSNKWNGSSAAAGDITGGATGEGPGQSERQLQAAARGALQLAPEKRSNEQHRALKLYSEAVALRLVHGPGWGPQQQGQEAEVTLRSPKQDALNPTSQRHKAAARPDAASRAVPRSQPAGAPQAEHSGHAQPQPTPASRPPMPLLRAAPAAAATVTTATGAAPAARIITMQGVAGAGSLSGQASTRPAGALSTQRLGGLSAGAGPGAQRLGGLSNPLRLGVMLKVNQQQGQQGPPLPPPQAP